MSRRVDDIDSIISPANSGVFGQNGDAALTLLIIRVHDALSARHFSVQRTGLLQQAIHQRRFAMVDVSNNGDVTKGFHRYLKSVGDQRFLARAECTPVNIKWFTLFSPVKSTNKVRIVGEYALL